MLRGLYKDLYGCLAKKICSLQVLGGLVDFSRDLGHEQKTKKLKGAAKDSQDFMVLVNLLSGSWWLEKYILFEFPGTFSFVMVPNWGLQPKPQSTTKLPYKPLFCCRPSPTNKPLFGIK